eukprot:gene2026-2348_t
MSSKLPGFEVWSGDGSCEAAGSSSRATAIPGDQLGLMSFAGGYNSFRQLGDGTLVDRQSPVAVSGVHDVAFTSADALAKCWGGNVYGQTGVPVSPIQLLPVTVPGLTSVVKVAAGGRHSCAGLKGGAIVCWGDNKAGQLGSGSLEDRLTVAAVDARGNVLNTDPAMHSLTAGDFHSCAVWTDGTVSCWGSNLYGQLGINSTVKFTALPQQVPGITDATWINAGDYHTCVTTKSGRAYCWGLNYAGKLGDGTTQNSIAPVQVLGLDNAVTIAAGGDHSCATLRSGEISCWGDNLYYQLGDGTTSRLPGMVVGVSGAISLSADHEHTCAALDNGLAVCWGGNTRGELGDNATSNLPIPVMVTGLDDVAVVGTGQLGDGSAMDRLTPVQAVGVQGVAPGNGSNILSLGEKHTCAVMAAGNVLCFGANDHGQLGDGTNTDRQKAVPVAGVQDARSVSCGHKHCCVSHVTGKVSCWGSNQELGDGTTTSRNTPGLVDGLADIRSVSAGFMHTCAVAFSGEVSCWGDNRKGQLGLEVAAAAEVPGVMKPTAVVPGLMRVQSISAGHVHTCAVMESGEARCWGDNEQAQLGNGTLSSFYQGPVTVAGLRNIRSVTAGDYHTCATTADTSVFCWGGNYLGQLGYVRVPGQISVPSSPCLQVTSLDPLSLREAPCQTARAVLTTPLVRGERGYLPISQEVHPGAYSSAVSCNHTGPVNDLVAACANEMSNIECRQANTQGLEVFSSPCASSIVSSIAACHRFDFVIGSNTRSACNGIGDDQEWLMIRYVDAEGFQQYGWVNAGAAELGHNVDTCPSTSCAALDPPLWECHQITEYDVPGVGLFSQPCFNQSLRLVPEDIPAHSIWYYYGSASKQTTTCQDKTADDFCWVRGRMQLQNRMLEGWLPVARSGPESHFVDSVCGTSAGFEVEYTKHHCGLNLASWTPNSLGHLVSVQVAAPANNSLLSATDLVPISILTNTNKMMMDSTQQSGVCGVPVSTGDQLIAYKPSKLASDVKEMLSGGNAGSNGKALEAVQALYNTCSNLPIPLGSGLAKQSFVWGVIGSMVNKNTTAQLMKQFQWFSRADAGKVLSKLLLRVPGFAACAAINPCTGDFLYAFDGLELLVDLRDIQLSPKIPGHSWPMEVSLRRKSEVQQLGLSQSGQLEAIATAWNPFSVHRKLAAVHAESLDENLEYRIRGNLLINTGAAVNELNISSAVPTSAYLPELKDPSKMTSVDIRMNFAGKVTIADNTKGWWLLLEGLAAYPAVLSLGGFVSLPRTFDIDPKRVTLLVHRKTGPTLDIWLRVQARIGLRQLLRTMPFGENMAQLVDGYKQMLSDTVNGFEVHYLAIEGGGMQAAVLAEVPYSQAMGRLASKVPQLSKLPLGTNVSVAAVVEDNAHGDWTATVSVWGTHDGRTYRGQVVMTCASVLLEYPLARANAVEHSRLVPSVCAGAQAPERG